MNASLLALAAVLTAPAQPWGPTTRPIEPETPVHLGVVLRLTHEAEMEALRAAQQDPRSPSFRQWLTPAEFGERFGQPEALVSRTQAWLAAAGFEVTVYPNQSFLEARGNARQVKTLLGVQLEGVPGKLPAVHVPNRRPQLPGWLKSQVVFISGLDTRQRFHHRLWDSFGDESLGPQDLRVQYDLAALQQAGFYGQGQSLVVLAWAEAPGNEVQTADVTYFFQNISDASAPFVQRILPNPENDFDQSPGGSRDEFELDLDMQSVGSPGAASITLESVPASQLFVLGPQDIANNLPTVTAVSTSIGGCEPYEIQYSQTDNEITAMRDAVIQGTMEGQTWSAAAGDNGADDCGIGQPPATVDFPASIPEIIAAGGSQISSPNFDANIALNAYNQEQVWNEAGGGFGGGAGGGGISTIFAEPSYQSGFGLSGRGVPDIALSAGPPETIADTNEPGELDPTEGTSIASPLSAGFFGLMASALGCRLGDIHATLYALGAAQRDGGAAVFHDIISGNNSADFVLGYDAGPGYDLASGWGSIDVAALVKAFPACPAGDGGFGVDAGAPYSQCAFIDCPVGCVTLAEGPSSCTFQSCNPAKSTNPCQLGDICSASGPYSGDGDAGVCLTGCNTNADCVDGGICQTCYGECVPPGNPTAQIGDPCETPSDCGTGGICLAYTGLYDGGYCSLPCYVGPGAPASCGCPVGSSCQAFGENYSVCLGDCPADGGACSRPGYVCQQQQSFGPDGLQAEPSSCQPACSVIDGGEDAGVYDTCGDYGPFGSSCDVDSGVCLLPPSPPDGGEGSSSGGSSGGSSSGGSGSSSEGTSSSGGSSPISMSSSSSSGAGRSSSSSGCNGTDCGSQPSASGSSSGSASSSTPVADAGTSGSSGGCGCSPVSGSPDLLWCAFAVLGLLRRRRRVGQ